MKTLEQEVQKFIKAHERSVLYGTLSEFEELYDLPALQLFRKTNIKSNIDKVMKYLEKDEVKYKEVYNKAWELIEPYLDDNTVYDIEPVKKPNIFAKIILSIFNIEDD